MTTTTMTKVALAAPAAESRPTDPNRCVAFAVEADADPGTLPRVLELFAKRGLVPLSLTSRLLGDRLAVEVEVVGMVQAESNHVGNCLRQIPMVSRVSVTDRTVPDDVPAQGLPAQDLPAAAD